VLREVQSIALMAFWISGAALADQITLKNGDHLSGTIVKSDGKHWCCTPSMRRRDCGVHGDHPDHHRKQLHVTTADKRPLSAR